MTMDREEREAPLRRRRRPRRSKAASMLKADFQPAKKPARGPQFLPIVAKPAQPAPRKLTRVAFKVSRLMEFCKERELVNQTGHSVYEWPLVVAKELIDNALDACEEAEVAPVISVAAYRRIDPDPDNTKDVLVVTDNGGGFDPGTIVSLLDYTTRVSSREAYVSPTRGAQGNALKTILAMGYVLDRKIGGGGLGVTEIESRGVKHRIEFRVDHVRNEPKIVHHAAPCEVTAGTKITVMWPPTNLLRDSAASFKQLVSAYAWFNPHLSMRGVWFSDEFVNASATNPAWAKWRPRDPTSAHWYDEARLERYLAAHVQHGAHRTVRDFLAEFLGLAGTQVRRKILDEVGCSHQSLADFFGVKEVNGAGIAKLLAAMKKHSKPVAPKRLGVIGKDHLRRRFLLAGGEEKTFKYVLRKGVTGDGVPYVVEFAFGLAAAALDPAGRAGIARVLVTGANWSAALQNPFRSFGKTGEGVESTMQKVRASSGQPVVCALHLACARIQFADRGKSSIILIDDAEQPED
jgi:DNA topoisomerase VI subunit B